MKFVSWTSGLIETVYSHLRLNMRKVNVRRIVPCALLTGCCGSLNVTGSRSRRKRLKSRPLVSSTSLWGRALFSERQSYTVTLL